MAFGGEGKVGRLVLKPPQKSPSLCLPHLQYGYAFHPALFLSKVFRSNGLVDLSDELELDLLED